jgi:hypothetical protein
VNAHLYSFSQCLKTHIRLIFQCCANFFTSQRALVFVLMFAPRALDPGDDLTTVYLDKFSRRNDSWTRLVNSTD